MIANQADNVVSADMSGPYAIVHDPTLVEDKLGKVILFAWEEEAEDYMHYISQKYGGLFDSYRVVRAADLPSRLTTQLDMQNDKAKHND